jgi:hypothetical protein
MAWSAWRRGNLAIPSDRCGKVGDMSAELSLSDLRTRWNEVLDLLERENRVAWMAFFDGRLESFDNGRLTLDFSDPAKLSMGHDYREARMRMAPQLQGIIRDIFGVSVVIIEK